MLTIFGGLLMPFAHLKTGRFHYEVFGDKQLPAVLLIMGLGMPAAGWPRSFISMLLEKSLRVITVDNRDAGLSEHFSHLKTSMSVPACHRQDAFFACRSRRPTFSKIWPST